MNTQSDSKAVIKDIANRLNDGNMSFIIGAGFSKNVSPKFLSWKELLHDMMVYMYEEERQSWHATDDELIGKYGYLGIASDYVRRKGYHEAIDHYIEERTPVLKKENDGSFFLEENGKVIERNVDIRTHKLLLNLGAHFIYTFNYDNTLEANEDRVESQEEKEEATLINKDYKHIRQFIEWYNERTTPIRNYISLDANNALNEMGQSNLMTLSMIVEELNEPQNLKVGDILLKKHIVDTINEDVKENKNRLENGFLETKAKKNEVSNINKYAVIRNSEDIRRSGYQNCIFKLHGSLRNKKDKFGFDEDTHLQYIICQEDYDSYSQKHEAFVDLMRISLLRESFCIIGFSCDDPKFLLWMNWVKDIKEKIGLIVMIV